ncbi:hypothetical protein ACWGKW_16940 [Streptomyces sp. NPDC054766]
MPTFGAGLALRRRRFPSVLTGPGTISYSVCLVHAVLLAVSDSVIGRYRQDDLVLEAAFFAVPLPLSVLTHRRVEVPGLEPTVGPGPAAGRPHTVDVAPSTCPP